MQMVRDYIEENRLSKASLARTLGLSPEALHFRLRGDFIECQFLIKLCKALNNDFYQDVSELIGMDKQSSKIAELEKEIEMLNREKELLISIIGNDK